MWVKDGSAGPAPGEASSTADPWGPHPEASREPDSAHPQREARPSQACLPGCHAGHQNLAGLLVNGTLSEPCFSKVAHAGDGQISVALPGAHSV